ncbi:MAG: hypothetical protein ACOCZQ_00480 [Nanoarchaeota archaeon]
MFIGIPIALIGYALYIRNIVLVIKGDQGTGVKVGLLIPKILFLLLLGNIYVLVMAFSM